MRMLVTGLHGQVVTALLERAGPGLEVIALGRPELDLAGQQDVAPLLAAHRADIVVNAAAYTAVDKAETETELALAINGRGAGQAAAAAAKLNIPVVQISTDYVFDGTAKAPIAEDAATKPLGSYGASKLAGERAVMAATPNHVILRTAWVYAPFGANFARTMLRLAATRDEVRVVGDQLGTPTSALDIAAAIETVARNLLAQPDNAALRGIFNMTAANGPVSWAQFAAEIFQQAAALGGPSARVVAIGTADYPTPARRPAYSCLDGTKLAALHHVAMPDWRDGLKPVMKRLAEGHWA